MQDVEEIIFWANNYCCGQNKNWILYSVMANVANLPLGPDQVAIRYLTKGHRNTDIADDGKHGNIVNKMGRKRNI